MNIFIFNIIVSDNFIVKVEKLRTALVVLQDNNQLYIYYIQLFKKNKIKLIM